MEDALYLGGAILLVVLNGFFVAAEFALVKIRPTRVEELVAAGRPFAKTAAKLARRMDDSLSACQLGITMASLGLGWVGEPAFARLLEPALEGVGITSPAAIHTIAFIVAFTLITALHLTIGEQAPKIFAIRRPEPMLLWCAAPLRFFCILFYPLLVGLSRVTAWMLRPFGITESAHEIPHTEDEIRRLLTHAHAHGELTRAEHRLLHAVFEFDDKVCRKIMVPRSELVFLDANRSLADNIALVRETKHTRYPVCDGSLDQVLGIAHIKDLVGVSGDADLDLRSVLRPPRLVPETMPVSRLLRDFQLTHELMALVVDEYGTLIGFVTLENVVEQIVGQLEDEFDDETPEIVPDGKGRFLVSGRALVTAVNAKLQIALEAGDVDTLSGLLTTRLGHIPAQGDEVELDGVTAEVLEAKGRRAARVRVTIPAQEPDRA